MERPKSNLKKVGPKVTDQVRHVKIQKALNQSDGSDILKDGLRMTLLDNNMLIEMGEKLSQTENTVICEAHADCCVEEAKVTVTRRMFLHVKREARKIKRDNSASQVLWLNSLTLNQSYSMDRGGPYIAPTSSMIIVAWNFCSFGHAKTVWTHREFVLSHRPTIIFFI